MTPPTDPRAAVLGQLYEDYEAVRPGWGPDVATEDLPKLDQADTAAGIIRVDTTNPATKALIAKALHIYSGTPITFDRMAEQVLAALRGTP